MHLIFESKNEYIDNLRYIPIGKSNELYAVVILVNIKLSVNTNQPIDIEPFLLATNILLKNQKQRLNAVKIQTTAGAIQEQNQSIIESMLQNTFHPAFLFNDEFKILKSNPASQCLFNSNVDRGWPSIDVLINRTLPSVASKILSSISKFFFLGHLDQQQWQNVELVLSNYQSIKVDIHLFDINYFNRQSFGLMINEKSKFGIKKENYDTSLQRFNALTSVVPMAIIQVDKDFNCSYVNKTWGIYTGQSHEQSIDKGWLSCLATLNMGDVLSEITRIVQQSKHYTGELQLISVNQDKLWVSYNAAGLFNDRFELTGLIFTMSDISDARIQSEKLQQMANYDHLTGLSNRGFFTDRLTVALSRSPRHGITALMFLDLDLGFKY